MKILKCKIPLLILVAILLIALPFFLNSNVIEAATSLKHVHLWWYENGIQQERLYIAAGSSVTINRDPGSVVQIRIFKVDSASSVIYGTADVNNGITREITSSASYVDFTNSVGSNSTQVWATVNTTEGRVQIIVNNIVPQYPDLTVSNITVDDTVSPREYIVGESVKVQCVVWNNGSTTAGSNRLGYYIGTSSTSTSNMWDYDPVDSLNATLGSTEYEYYTFSASDVGTRYFVFYADYQNSVNEGNNENNNKAYFGPFSVIQSNVSPTVEITQPSEVPSIGV